MADSSSVALRYTEEATRGTTPENNLQTLRFVSENFEGTKETIVSDEIAGDAQVGGIFEAGYGSAGSGLLAAGKVKLKTLPWPGTPPLLTPTSPPNFSTMRRTMDKPKPCPWARD